MKFTTQFQASVAIALTALAGSAGLGSQAYAIQGVTLSSFTGTSSGSATSLATASGGTSYSGTTSGAGQTSVGQVAAGVDLTSSNIAFKPPASYDSFVKACGYEAGMFCGRSAHRTEGDTYSCVKSQYQLYKKELAAPGSKICDPNGACFTAAVDKDAVEAKWSITSTCKTYMNSRL